MNSLHSDMPRRLLGSNTTRSVESVACNNMNWRFEERWTVAYVYPLCNRLGSSIRPTVREVGC
jgi:hypothetical protein